MGNHWYISIYIIMDINMVRFSYPNITYFHDGIYTINIHIYIIYYIINIYIYIYDIYIYDIYIYMIYIYIYDIYIYI